MRQKLGCIANQLLRSKFSSGRSVIEQVLSQCRKSAVRCHSVMCGDTGIRLGDLIKDGTAKLVKKGILVEEAASSVDIIAAKVLGHKTLYFLSNDLLVQPSQALEISRLLAKREDRIPVQYVIEETDFRDITLEMKRPVFIPRPETEDLVNYVTQHILNSNPSRFLEIGCGTGAISISLLLRVAQLKGFALDISLEACDLTKLNAKKHGVHNRLTVYNMDVQDTGSSQVLREIAPCDLIVSNPPYLTNEEMDSLEPEIYRYEDHRAFTGGDDGFNIIRVILNLSTSLLTKGGNLWLEVNLHHPSMIKQHLEKNPDLGLMYLSAYPDFTGRNRFCHLMKR